MKPAKSFLLLLLLALAQILPAQAPGYMGKRFSVSYGLHLGPSFSRNTTSGGFLSAKHEANLGICLSERYMMCLSTEFFSTINKNVNSLTTTFEAPANYYSITGRNYSLLFKKFKKGYVAPWGAYFMFGPQVNYFKSSYNNYMYYTERVNNHDTLISNFGAQTQKFFKADFVMGWGKSRVFKDRVVVDWGMIFRVRSFFSMIVSPLFTGSLTSTEYIPRTAAIRVNRLNGWNAYVRVGYLF